MFFPRPPSASGTGREPDRLPPRRVAFWAMGEFRLLILLVILVSTVVLVFTFEVGRPLLRTVPLPEDLERPAYAPLPEGAAREVRFDGILDRVKDGGAVDIADQDEPYWRLLRYLSMVDDQALARESVRVDYPMFGRHSAELRGRPVRVSTLFVDEDAAQRVDPSKAGVDFVRRVYLSDLSGSQGYFLDLLEPPPASLIRRRSVIAVDALFYKTVTYEAKKGSQTVPLLLARSVRGMREIAATSPLETGTIVVVVSSILGVTVAIVLTRRIVGRVRSARIAGAPVRR